MLRISVPPFHDEVLEEGGVSGYQGGGRHQNMTAKLLNPGLTLSSGKQTRATSEFPMVRRPIGIVSVQRWCCDGSRD
jgi:hypothetical protein